jgi:hypothetical protein
MKKRNSGDDENRMKYPKGIRSGFLGKKTLFRRRFI